jgi:hypothetical protein
MKNLEPGRINFGAFPRSGNHTLGKTLSLAFPDVGYFWLQHRITDLKTAPNCAVVVRNPLESIASWMECSFDNRPDGAERLLDWYIRYMNGILVAKDNVIVFTLEDLSTDPHACAVAYGERFGFGQPAEFTKDDVGDWLSQNMPDHFPRDTSNNKTARYDSILSSERYSEAVGAYSKVLSLAYRVNNG